MADQDRHEPGPTERTPTGYEVSIPERGEFFDNLEKLARPKPRDPAPASPKK